mgnify:FL=1
MQKIILIKYGELTTKKDNRSLFINILYENITKALQNYNVKITKNRVRMFIETDENIEEIIEILKNIFGIHSIVVAYKVDTNINKIQTEVLNIVQKLNFKTFKVETKRADKNFSIPSMEMNNILGGLILKNKENVTVDVHNPEYTLKVEIREDYTYIYAVEINARGGYPVRVAGKGLLMLSGGIDSPVAGYMAMKRGVKIECIYFESPPHTSEMALNKVKKLVKKLTKFEPEITLHIINFTNIQEEIYKNCDSNYMITIMRRMMYRISEEMMKRRKCLILINGESIGQVASQTLTSMSTINNVTNVPVIRPLACFDKLKIIKIAKDIDTYDISTLPYEDCCTIFLPRHPVINPKLTKAIEEEQKINYEKLIEETVNNANTIVITASENKKYDF